MWFQGFNDVFKEVDDTFRLVNKVWSTPSSNAAYWTDEVSKYTSEIMVPGVKKEEVSVEIAEGYVVVKAKNNKSNYIYHLSLPQDADLNTLTATLDLGILLLTIEKVTPEKSKVLKIEVK